MNIQFELFFTAGHVYRVTHAENDLITGEKVCGCTLGDYKVIVPMAEIAIQPAQIEAHLASPHIVISGDLYFLTAEGHVYKATDVYSDTIEGVKLCRCITGVTMVNVERSKVTMISWQQVLAHGKQ